jgi:hypothetical protein
VNTLLNEIEGQNNYPVWVRFFTFFMGVTLFGIGIRRFFIHGETGNIEADSLYFFIGSVCLIILGYSRRLFINDIGLVRVTNIWGRKTTEVLVTWNEVERVIYSEKRDAFVACFERGNIGYRLFVDYKYKDSLCELIQYYYKY